MSDDALTETMTEILADKPEDIATRRATTEDLTRFKGLPGQIVVNPDDFFRPHVMDGENYGGRALAFVDDVKEELGIFFPVKRSVKGNSDTLVLDLNKGNVFLIESHVPNIDISLDYPEPENTDEARRIEIYFRHIVENSLFTLPGIIQLNTFLPRQINAGDTTHLVLTTFDSGALWFGTLDGSWSRTQWT